MRRLIKPCGLHCIKINDIGVKFAEQTALEHVNLHIHCGALAAVIGKNGAGKSTLIRAILDDIPHTGTIEFKDHKNGNMQNMRIGYVPQKLNIEKKTPVSVYDMIASYQSGFPVFLKKRAKVQQQILENLRLFQAEDLIDRQVCNLSGGELQRVLLSMAVMSEPNLLLLDEPVSGIDQNGMDLFYETVNDLKQNYDLAVILISHDLDYVARYADQVVLLDKTVKKQGTVRQVYESPEFQQVFGRFDIDSFRNMRGKEQSLKASALNKELVKQTSKRRDTPGFPISDRRGRL
ncbi:Zinc import ATP-binding protein ZnuC [uncultured Roseburia sp.]|uniref:Metal ABC transporter ATP-binding protein n=1 Tax=Brotonthovivens ammoniilytica TaxID=2981725 RepID=A0ABT2TLH8_9FIRM|nr:metal ABC transporter ATP-binding protein [Brotonthovivens ammoniilytica]MCU6762389.1 metal ABC transporter ATP-binding protein [Brotonthovivens ammoniilytica]SCI70202.1 Zinc import ATP-binding protein ZnuC [uncultured Roseburia sp.]